MGKGEEYEREKMKIAPRIFSLIAVSLMASCDRSPDYEGDGSAHETRAGIFSGYQVLFPKLLGDGNVAASYQILRAKNIDSTGYLALTFEAESEADFKNPGPLLEGCIFQLDVIDGKGNFVLRSVARQADLHQAVGPELWPAMKTVKVFKDDWKLSVEELSRQPLRIDIRVDRDQASSCKVRQGIQLILSVGGVK